MIGLTGGLFLVAVAQAALFWRQLGIMDETLSDAKRAADAATDGAVAAKHAAVATEASVNAMRDTAERQLRAYVGVKGWEASAQIAHEGDTPHAWDIAAEFENFGQTPARHLTLVLLDGWVAAGDKPDWPTIAPVRADDPGQSVAPSAAAITGYFTITFAQVLHLWNGKSDLYGIACARYRDVFENTPSRMTTMSVQITARYDPRVVVQPFRFTASRPYNAFD